MAIGTNQPNNQVPKDTVDNIMKTYENIINQHLKSMEQISESIKNLHTASYEIEKNVELYIDKKVKEVQDRFDKNVEEKRKILEKIEDDITGPTKETDTNLKGVNENIENVAIIVKCISKEVKGLKQRFILFVTIISMIMGLVATTYVYVQKSNDELIKNSIAKAVATIISTRPGSTVPDDIIKKLDKNNDGAIDEKEIQEVLSK